MARAPTTTQVTTISNSKDMAKEDISNLLSNTAVVTTRTNRTTTRTRTNRATNKDTSSSLNKATEVANTASRAHLKLVDFNSKSSFSK